MQLCDVFEEPADEIEEHEGEGKAKKGVRKMRSAGEMRKRRRRRRRRRRLGTNNGVWSMPARESATAASQQEK